MSKMQSILFGVVILVLCAATGYLGLQYAALQTSWEQAQENRAAFLENSENWSNDLDAIKTALEKQQTEIAQIKDQWQTELAALQDNLESNYLTKHPVFTLKDKIFDYDESTLTVQAQTDNLSKWKNDNAVYLPQILKQSLKFASDLNIKGVTLTEVAPGSIFAQMGLQAGDRLLGINGAPMNRTDALYTQLLNPKNTKLSVLRGDQNLILTFRYSDTALAQNTTATDLPDDSTAATSNNKIEVSDTSYNQTKAVKIVTVDSNQVSTLKANDVVLSINGQNVADSKSFYETLQNSEESLFKFDIVRDGKTEQVDVAVSE